MSPMRRLTCGSLLETIRRSAPVLEELDRYNIIRPELIDGNLAIQYKNEQRLSSAARQWLAQFGKINDRALINMWLETRVAVDGPKVFQPTVEQCLAMEQVAPRVAIGEYAQPYPVMLIDLPDGYRQQRTCQTATVSGSTTHGPACIIIGIHGQPPWTVWLDLIFDSASCVQWAVLPESPTIEDGIARRFGPESYVPAEPTPGRYGADQGLIMAGMTRLAVNSMLLLSDFGCKHLGPLNEPHYRRLEHYAAMAKKRGARLVDAQRDLRMAPQLYGFSQEVVLYGKERGAATPDDGDGEAHRRPHWRRGHWKTHAHGPNLSLRKRLFIKPVLVNWHLLREGEGISQTTYRMPGRKQRPEA
jgi:hypothetical protein